LSKIKILSEHIANQIAAGEVIERPASVVKELLENSIDAGARQVNIEVQGNGTRLIRVVDDGLGMDSDDILLCLERHATSKLSESRDDKNRLAAIRTLGFRGEAIPSIASVSKMTIISRPETESLGTQVEVRYYMRQAAARAPSWKLRICSETCPPEKNFSRVDAPNSTI
jgi:DNA mismatch repair protein MutL